jgi:DNA-binding LytR/AlgR family response regulator
MKILLLEDEAIVIKDLEMSLREMGYPSIMAFNKGDDFIQYTQTIVPDLCIVDIHLKGSISGIEAVKLLKSRHSCPIPVIYLTAQGDKATLNEALETMPSAYLLKPFNAFELHAAIELAILNHETAANTSDKEVDVEKNKVFFRHQNKFESIEIGKVWFLEAEGNYTKLHCERGHFLLVCQLGKFANIMYKHFMYRCHRSFIINMHKVESFDERHIYIEGSKIPLAKNRKKEFLERLTTL